MVAPSRSPLGRDRSGALAHSRGGCGLVNPRCRPQALGLTLVELLGVLALLGALLAGGLPAWASWQARRLVTAAAGEFESELQRARLHALATGEAVHLAFRTAGGRTCQLLHTGRSGRCRCEAAPGDPGAAPQVHCEEGARLLRLVVWPLPGGLQVQSNAGSLAFEPLHGTVTPTATVRIAGPQGTALAQVINVMGRVRRCVPLGAVPWPGLPPC